MTTSNLRLTIQRASRLIQPGRLVVVALMLIMASTTVFAGSDASQTGFSDGERKVLSWILFFMLSGAFGGVSAKNKKK